MIVVYAAVGAVLFFSIKSCPLHSSMKSTVWVYVYVLVCYILLY